MTTERQAWGLERLSINTATVRERWNVRQCIEGFARHGAGGIAVWREALAEFGTDEVARMIADHGLTVTGLCRAGQFPATDAAGRQEIFDRNRLAVDEAAAIGARCLILVAGGLPPDSKDLAGARAQVRDGIGPLLEYARSAGVVLALEPLHPMYAADRACVNTLDEANDLCDAFGDGLGIALDIYHVWWDPNLEAQIRRAGPERIVAFHLCDWLVPTTDLLLDRGMMGDGVADIPKIRGWLEDVGYQGLGEVEIFSAHNWWQRDPEEVVAVAKERFRTAI